MNYGVVIHSTMSLPKRLLCSSPISKMSALALPRSLVVGLTNSNWGPPGSSSYEIMLRRMASDGELRQRATLENCIDDTSWKWGCEALLEAGKREGPEKILGEVNAHSDGALLRAVVETDVKTATSPQKMKGRRPIPSSKKRFSSDIERERLALIQCQRNVEIGLMHGSLYDWVVKWCQENEKERLGEMNVLLKHCDLSRPEQWYGHTRLMQRRVIFHGGPTNSGKTHNALECLKMARGGECGKEGGGIYCSPLRLLALEIYNRLNQEGVYTDLLTGQERRQMPIATHTACTVELANIGRTFDVAVIDEIQMIADPQRGKLTSSSPSSTVQLSLVSDIVHFLTLAFAKCAATIGHSWTRALLGLRARELHVCGGMEAADYVKRICERTGDSFEIYEYERKSPLHAQTVSLGGDFSKVRPGDCIVAFSKKNLYSIRREVELLTKLKCCIVYGQLPPETRRCQADLFNATDSGYDVLVASDAIGMGLNLNMRRVIFYSIYKRRDNDVVEPIPPTLIKQIAGRAGRFSSQWGSGEVTCLNHEDMDYMRSCLATPLEPLSQGGVFPPQEQMASFLDALSKSPLGEELLAGNDASPTLPGGKQQDVERRKTTKLGSNMVNVMKNFLSLARVENDFFLCGSRETEAVAEVLKEVSGLSLGQCYELCLAPVNYRDHLVMGHMQRYAARYANGKTVGTNVKLPVKKFRPKQLDDVNRLCSKYASLDLYVWLCNKLPRVFVEGDLAFRQREYAIYLIDQALNSSILDNKTKKKQIVGRKLGGRGLTHLKTHQSKLQKSSVVTTAAQLQV